jgi:hypothetical protein
VADWTRTRALNREAARRYRERNRDEVRRRWRDHARQLRADPEVCAQLAEASRDYYARIRAQVLAHYSPADPPSCACCGATDDLTIDHLDGDGEYHRWLVLGPDTRSVVRFYAYLVREGFPDDPPFQVMCLPCNSSKGAGDRCQLWHGDPAFARCTVCGEVKALEEFKPRHAKRNGRDSWCRKCSGVKRKVQR